MLSSISLFFVCHDLSSCLSSELKIMTPEFVTNLMICVT
uniref:Uncharacterized protein n=1 Tax=Rhizophora mucronata TaxID=61149 RepID=A0A2P2N0A7_RHIMU